MSRTQAMLDHGRDEGATSHPTPRPNPIDHVSAPLDARTVKSNVFIRIVTDQY
jgi:hypothetical protein